MRQVRDRATDHSTLVDYEAVGLAFRNPETGQLELRNPSVSLGYGTSRLPDRDPKTGRPDFYDHDPFISQSRDERTVAAEPHFVAPGTIRREVAWPLVGIGGRGLFSATSNTRQNPDRPFQPTPVRSYFLSSLFLGLPRALSWVVAGRKPSIPEAPSGHVPNVSLAAGTGWPVVAPSIPSYGSRIPLLRPRGLVSNA